MAAVTAPARSQTIADDSPEPQGLAQYVLLVTPQFQSADVEAIGGDVSWIWPEAGVAVVTSNNPTFREDATAIATVRGAVPNLHALRSERASAGPSQAVASPDAYLEGLQWPLQAVGAVSYPDGRTPFWQLDQIDGHAYQGAGVTLCDVGTGMPAMEVAGEARLHSDFLWYTAEEGGVVPVFRSSAELDAYYALHGQAEGMDPSQAIVDPELGGFDTAGDSTAFAGVVAGRYSPAREWSVRGLSPQVRYIGYSTDTGYSDLTHTLLALRRAASDGCQIVTIQGIFFSGNQLIFGSGTENLRKVYLNVLQELDRRNILVVSPALDWGVSSRDFRMSGSPPFWMLPQDAPNTLLVGGTAPRDYDPGTADLRVYDPQPGVPKGVVHNLDRPGVFDAPFRSTGFGDNSLAAPAGSLGGTYNTIFSAAIAPDPVYGYHDGGSSSGYASAYVSAVAALAVEAYTRSHGAPPTTAVLRDILARSADDSVGPEQDDVYLWDPELSATGNVVLDVFALDYSGWTLTAVNADRRGRDAMYGAGRINAYRAIVASKDR